jgi:histidyl-tRNA synthetase
MKYQNVRGTHDLYGELLEKFNKVESVTKNLATAYNFKEIRTPIFEFASVFEKNVGEGTDIIGKEMYIFEDRSGEKMALRPEGTAPVVRSLISNGLTHKLPLKYFYMGPMFRYERPQKGRQRQFHQLGFEYLGTNHYSSDIEMINLALDILKNLGIHKYKLIINSIGSLESLNSYKKSLVDFLTTKKDSLSEDSVNRLITNPLRILDSKSPQDKEIIEHAPKITNYLIPQDKAFFESVKKGLRDLNIEYIEEPTLVRGLDYYTHTVFEIITDELGAQGTLIAGGRYNNMIKQMGGVDTGAFGFAGGIERLSLMVDVGEKIQKTIAMISSKQEQDSYVLSLAKNIREANFGASFILGKDVSSKLKKVTQEEFFCTIIIGEAEANSGNLNIKDAITREQFSIKEENLVEFLNSQYKTYKI